MSSNNTLVFIVQLTLMMLHGQLNPGRFGPGSFRPIFGVGHFGLSRCVVSVSALSHFGPISIGIEAVYGKDRDGCCGRIGLDGPISLAMDRDG